MAIVSPPWIASARRFAPLSMSWKQFREPRNRRVERLAAGDPLELDRPQLVAAPLVLADHPGLAAQGCVHREPRAFADQRQVGFVRGSGAREITALLH